MFNAKKQKAIEIFHEYLAVCDQLYAAKEKQGKGDPEEFSNALEKKMGRMAVGHQFYQRFSTERNNVSW